MLSMNCDCSQGGHTAPVKHIEVSSGAIEKLAQILEGYTDITHNLNGRLVFPRSTQEEV